MYIYSRPKYTQRTCASGAARTEYILSDYQLRCRILRRALSPRAGCRRQASGRMHGLPSDRGVATSIAHVKRCDLICRTW